MDERQKREMDRAVLNTVVSSLEAQLRAVIRLRDNLPRARKKAALPDSSEARSQLDLVEEVLRRASSPLHIDQIIERIQKTTGITLDRESVVSALSKKVHRGERFLRTGKNTFALLTE